MTLLNVQNRDVLRGGGPSATESGCVSEAGGCECGSRARTRGPPFPRGTRHLLRDPSRIGALHSAGRSPFRAKDNGRGDYTDRENGTSVRGGAVSRGCPGLIIAIDWFRRLACNRNRAI
ncbi:hypothetical protein CEXT_72291 [Caerostris extrusa]|uniref:Uncharacterized protein n=1 Tax=Caerostris extrusa TaxID=172846 RepID=A0AAV4M4X3_CAEEX|nr:hypothetical protein CEXT_72291 [Caerostris extrusa]